MGDGQREGEGAWELWPLTTPHLLRQAAGGQGAAAGGAVAGAVAVGGAVGGGCLGGGEGGEGGEKLAGGGVGQVLEVETWLGEM